MSLFVCVVILICNLVLLHARETPLPQPAKTGLRKFWSFPNEGITCSKCSRVPSPWSCIYFCEDVSSCGMLHCFSESSEFRSRQIGCCQRPQLTGRKGSSPGHSCSLSRYITGWVLCHHLYLKGICQISCTRSNANERFKGFWFWLAGGNNRCQLVRLQARRILRIVHILHIKSR